MDFIALLETKYPYISKEDRLAILNKAKMFYYGAMYPFDSNASEETKPITTFFGKQWILSACDELVERLGFSSALGYKENGVSWNFDNAHISDRLMNLLTPIVGVI
jgi:hypothetical protein